MAMESQQSERAVVAVFQDRGAAEDAVHQLERMGFDHERIGFALRGAAEVRGGMITDTVGTKDGVGAMTGAVTGGMLGGVLAAAVAMLIPGVGPVVAGGVLASFFGGAIAGTAVGGILGALQGLGVSETEAKFYDTHFQSGRAIVAVKAGGRAPEAADLLVRLGGEHVHSESTSPIETRGVFSTP
jgi:hypothetical protein